MQQRIIIANEAARLLYEDGYHDYHLAKLKALKRLNSNGDKSNQPSNKEIHQALVSRIKNYSTPKDQAHLQTLRQEALSAMQFLESFQPVLVGAVLDGTAGKHTPICLHLFADSIEEVIFFLSDQQIPFQEQERSLLIAGKQTIQPFFSFFADDFAMELMVFTEKKPVPTSSITGKAMQRMGYSKLVELCNKVISSS